MRRFISGSYADKYKLIEGFNIVEAGIKEGYGQCH